MEIYLSQLTIASKSIESAVDDLSLFLNTKTTIYLTGVGKSGHIARKCVATWQSLGLSAHYLLIQDMLHGDIGVLRPRDTIVYISNSGNTEEVKQVSSYIKRTKPDVIQVLVTNNVSPMAATNVHRSITIGSTKIIEADLANCAPTVSSVIFMIFLDLLGIHLVGGGSKDTFKHNHPSGELGKTEP
jgi:arabinose-5-phosphate isomerase